MPGLAAGFDARGRIEPPRFAHDLPPLAPARSRPHRAARDAVAHDYDVVVAAGGDGTIGLVGRQLLGTRCALGILPVGSVMNIPRMLGLSRDIEQAAEVIGAGSVRAIDVGQVGDRIFYEAGSPIRERGPVAMRG